MITTKRAQQLETIANRVNTARSESKALNLVFVCTHNSRRSQASEWWARRYLVERNITDIFVHSAGTEVTRFHQNMIDALQRAGADLKQSDMADNPEILDQYHAVTMYSKTYEEVAETHDQLFAIMVCDDAREHCSVIPGALGRVNLNFKDPKFADGTPEQADAYDACVQQIGEELSILFSAII